MTFYRDPNLIFQIINFGNEGDPYKILCRTNLVISPVMHIKTIRDKEFATQCLKPVERGWQSHWTLNGLGDTADSILTNLACPSPWELNIFGNSSILLPEFQTCLITKYLPVYHSHGRCFWLQGLLGVISIWVVKGIGLFGQFRYPTHTAF